MAVRDDDQLTLEMRLTQAGAELLRAELAELTDVARPAALRRLHAAYESGATDGSTEMTDARWALDRIERRIQRLEGQLRSARIVTDEDLAGDRISVGHRVDVRRADGSDRSYVLVSPVEGDPRTRRLSVDSPLGRALLGQTAGDVVTLEHTGEEVVVTGFGSPDRSP